MLFWLKQVSLLAIWVLVLAVVLGAMIVVFVFALKVCETIAAMPLLW